MDLATVDEAEWRLAAIVASSDDAIIGKTLDGVVTSWNAAAERLYGYTAEEMIGRPVSLLSPPERPDEVPVILERIRRGERVDHYECVRVGKGGRRVSVSLTVSPIRARGGAIVGASAIARDVTDRKRVEALFRGLLESAPDAIVGVNSDGRIALVNAQAERLFGYSRGELEGQPVELLMPERVRGVHPRHRSGYFANPVTRPMGAGQELAGRRKDGSEFPAEIGLSAIDTEEGTLVSAAIRDFTDRGAVMLTVREPDDDMVRIDVADTGVGIPPEDQPRIFLAFEQVDSGHSRQREGTGLGLHICQRLVELLGGRLSFASEPGAGSTFSVRIPRR